MVGRYFSWRGFLIFASLAGCAREADLPETNILFFPRSQICFANILGVESWGSAARVWLPRGNFILVPPAELVFFTRSDSAEEAEELCAAYEGRSPTLPESAPEQLL